MYKKLIFQTKLYIGRISRGESKKKKGILQYTTATKPKKNVL